MTRKITTAELTEAMNERVRLITVNGEDSRFRGASKDIHFVPSSGEFIITTWRGPNKVGKDVITQTRGDVVRLFNAIDLGKL